MRVLMISNDKRIYNPESRVGHRMKSIGDLTDGLKILILGLNGKAINLSSKTEVIPVSGKLLGVFRALNIARKLNQKNSFGIVTAQDPFLAGLVGFLIKKFLHLKLQIQIHTDISNCYFWKETLANHLRYWLALFLVPRADSIRVVSERIRDSLLSKFSHLKVSVLPIFVDAERIKNTKPSLDLHRKYPQFNFIILMASRFTREKNIEMAIQAMQKITINHPAVGLIIIGQGPMRKKYEAEIKKLRLENNVVLESWAEDTTSYYKTADLFVLTSNYEGYGLALIEAMLAGCPIISTDVGIAGEVIKDGRNGFVIKVGNKTALMQAILKLIENKELQAQIRRNNLIADPLPYSSARTYFENYVKLLEAK